MTARVNSSDFFCEVLVSRGSGHASEREFVEVNKILYKRTRAWSEHSDGK